MKLAVVGSRGFSNYQLLVDELDNFLNDDLVIISGGAKGADSLGEKFADENNLQKIIFKPEWEKYGKAAGMIRNKLIIKSADCVIAFWDGVSKGTKNSIELAKKSNKICKIIKINENV